MKNNKWLNYTLSIFLTLVVLTVVAGAGFRAGMMQNLPLARGMNGARPSFVHDNFSRLPQQTQDDFRGDKGQTMRNDFQEQAPRDVRGFNFRDDGFPFPIFGLIQLAVLGLVVWIGYKLVKKSGWRLSLTKTSPAPASAFDTPPSVQAEEIKESE